MKLTSSYAFAVIISVLLHTALLLTVMYSWQSVAPRVLETPKYVKASLVDVTEHKRKEAAKQRQIEDAKQNKIKEAARKKQEQLKEKQRKEQAVREKVAEEKAEKEKAAKQKLAEQQAKKEQEEKVEVQRRAKQQEQQLQRERENQAREAVEQQERERIAKEESIRRQTEARSEQQRAEREQKERQRRLREQEALAAALAEEEVLLQTEEDDRIASDYVAYITERIQQNWNRPITARSGMKVVLLIHLIPTGEVISVNVIESSGNTAFDRSAERAVNKVGRFEQIKSMPSRIFERDFRNLTIRFMPKDLEEWLK